MSTQKNRGLIKVKLYKNENFNRNTIEKVGTVYATKVAESKSIQNNLFACIYI